MTPLVFCPLCGGSCRPGWEPTDPYLCRDCGAWVRVPLHSVPVEPKGRFL